jgi:hypothetical protein
MIPEMTEVVDAMKEEIDETAEKVLRCLESVNLNHYYSVKEFASLVEFTAGQKNIARTPEHTARWEAVENSLNRRVTELALQELKER